MFSLNETSVFNPFRAQEIYWKGRKESCSQKRRRGRKKKKRKKREKVH